MNINTNNFRTNSPPASPPPDLEEDLVSQPTSNSDCFLSAVDFSILHFNCQNSIQFTHEALTKTNFTLLSFQEPWFNSYSLSFPPHEAWHRITAYDYHPSAWSDRPRVCMYLSKSISTSQFSILPSSSDIILAIDIRYPDTEHIKLRVISWYNPPGSLRGFHTLKYWMSKYHNRSIPIILVSDTNLHHRIWNPPDYTITDPLAKKLIHFCSNTGLKLISPKGVPTRFSANTHSTTIDLVWASWNLIRNVTSCRVQTDSLASDHFPVATTLDLALVPAPTTHISFKISEIDCEELHKSITSKFQSLPTDYTDPEKIDSAVSTISNIIVEAAQAQGRKVTTRPNRFKSWWDKDHLNPIIKNRNRARKWMIKSGLPEARACYAAWQKYFKDQVIRTKTNHWKQFLANSSSNNTFKAFRYVKPCATSEIAPLKKHDGSVATTKEEQASLLYHGTSVAHAEADLSDIPPDFIDNIQSLPLVFPPLEPQELTRTVNKLPNRRAKGEDCISNELIKMALPAIEVELCNLFNACFRLGHFPTMWRKAITIIIRKNGKDNYSDPNAYRPIALLSCLGKILEKIITSRVTYWAESMKVIAPGHMGGRRHHSTDDALLILTTWIKERWRAGEVVSALSLDVKSAYPSVHKMRLWFTLFKHNCPTYLLKLIQGFLSGRSTNLRLQDFLSISFDSDDGLPQGSPLSVILYIIYNSPLLYQSPPSPNTKDLSLGFIDDIIHVVASKSLDENIVKLQIHADSALDWGNSHGAIFDRKKAQLIHFTNKRIQQPLPSLVFGDVLLCPKQEIRWLGVWFDSKLLFNSHLQHVKKTGDFTLHQLRRLCKVFSGLSPRETKKLVITVLFSRIFYGSIVWFTKRNFSKANKIITSIQNAALHLILGAFRGSAIDLLYHDSYMIPFHLLITKRHHSFCLKRLTSPDTHPTRIFIQQELDSSSKKHKSPIQDLLRFEEFRDLTTTKIETIFPHSFPPWSNTKFNLLNLDKRKEEVLELIPRQVEEAEKSGAIVIFTDGSASEEGGGAAAVSSQSDKSISVAKTDIFSNHETELLGLLLASQLAKELLRRSDRRVQDIMIFSDNQSVLQLVHDIPRATSGQHLVIKAISSLQQLSSDSIIKLCWTPGHAGIELNEKADVLAKQAVVDQNPIIQLPASLGSLTKIVKRQFHPRLFPFKPGTKPYVTKPKLIAETLLNMEKGRSAVITQLRSGHSPLNDHLFKRNMTDSPLCPKCKVRETTEHFLLFCSKYKKARRRFRRRLREEEIKINWNNTIKILDSPKTFFLLSNYILETQRFMFFRSYVQDTAQGKQPNTKGFRRQRSARLT